VSKYFLIRGTGLWHFPGFEKTFASTMIYHYYTIHNAGYMEYNFDDKIHEDIPLNTLNDTVPF